MPQFKQVQYGETISKVTGERHFIFNSFQCGDLTPRQYLATLDIEYKHGSINSTQIAQGQCTYTGVINYRVELTPVKADSLITDLEELEKKYADRYSDKGFIEDSKRAYILNVLINDAIEEFKDGES